MKACLVGNHEQIPEGLVILLAALGYVIEQPRISWFDDDTWKDYGQYDIVIFLEHDQKQQELQLVHQIVANGGLNGCPTVIFSHQSNADRMATAYLFGEVCAVKPLHQLIIEHAVNGVVSA